MPRHNKANKQKRHSKARTASRYLLQPHDDVTTWGDNSHTSLTMQTEARNTELSSGRRLQCVSWKMGIPFVAGGDMQLQDLEDGPNTQTVGQIPRDSEASPQVDINNDDDQQPLFFSDTTRLSYTAPHLGAPAARTSSMSGSIEAPQNQTLSDNPDSSDDQVIFKGRKTASRPLCKVSSFATASQRIDTAVWTVTSEKRGSRQCSPHSCSNTKQSQWTRKFDNIFSRDERDEAEILADYVAHIDQDEASSSSSSQNSGNYGRLQSNKTGKASAALTCDLDRLKNVHISDQNVGCEESPATPGTDEREVSFEIPKPVPTIESPSPNTSDGDMSSDDDYQESSRPERLDQHHSSDKSLSESDNKAAESPEVTVDVDIDKLSPLDHDFISFSNYLRDGKKGKSGPKFKGQRGQRGQRRQQAGGQSFPSASALADALEQDPYGGFDVMDFERPSLRKTSKGRRQMPLFDASDSDLEVQLMATWENDRKKKKAKKQEREERRAAGLLGKKSAKAVKKATYTNGISVEDLKADIRKFLLSSSESLSLAPMDKKRRQAVHEIANAVTLKSQSRGSGLSRFPMLYKTGRTLKFDSTNIYLLDDAFSSYRIRRLGGPSQYGRSLKIQGEPRTGGRNLAVSYLDGDVVGGAAPELGADNRGRAMLEKMGWTDGTALGAVNNKGILHPVAHVVRNTRAGLG